MLVKRFPLCGIFLSLGVFAFMVAFCPTGGEADARPFLRLRACPPGGCQVVNQPTPPPAIGPLPESKGEDRPVPQPWLEPVQTDDTSSQPPPIALDPLPGTGSRLPIGPKVPDQITHKLDPAAIAAIMEALKGSSLPKQPVAISLPVEAETSQRLSRILMILEALAWLGGVTFGGSAVGKFLPLVARLVNGLQSSLPAQSPPSATTPAAPSSPPPKT